MWSITVTVYSPGPCWLWTEWLPMAASKCIHFLVAISKVLTTRPPGSMNGSLCMRWKIKLILRWDRISMVDDNDVHWHTLRLLQFEPELT